MRPATDAVTAVPRLVPVDDPGEDDGCLREPAGPLFLAPGDRLLSDGTKSDLTVTRARDKTFAPTAGWDVRRSHGHPRPRATGVSPAHGSPGRRNGLRVIPNPTGRNRT